MAAYKDKLIEDFNAKPYRIGEEVYAIVKEAKTRIVGRGKSRHEEEYFDTKRVEGSISNVDGDNITVKVTRYLSDEFYTVNKSDIEREDLFRVGADPFVKKHWQSEMRVTAFPLGSIIGILGIERKGDCFRQKHEWIMDGVNIEKYNDDPFIIDRDGNKQYYQRGYVWTEEQQKDLIRSIFNHMDCGKIVVRRRDPEWVEKEIKSGNRNVSLIEIVDGKQRLNAIKRYLNDEFDVDGYYYTDLSEYAQRELDNVSSITFCEFREKVSDEDIIQAFLNVNYTGVQCSKEHLEYVKEINRKM